MIDLLRNTFQPEEIGELVAAYDQILLDLDVERSSTIRSSDSERIARTR
jgi:hypothetical protein